METRSGETLGQRIRVLRERESWTIEQLAERLGSTKSAVNHWELDHNDPSVDMIVALARLFEVSTDWLLTGTDPEELGNEEERELIAFYRGNRRYSAQQIRKILHLIENLPKS